MSDKKGVSYILVGLIGLVIALLVLIIFTVFVWKPFVIETADDYTCFISVVLKSKTRKPPLLENIPLVGDTTFGFNSPLDLRCKMHDKKVKTSEQAKEVIADEMASCWGRLGEGKFNFYSDIDASGWFKKNNLCYVCSRIKSDEEIKVENQEMVSYLIDKKPRPLVDKRTYAQYITGTGFKRGEFLTGLGDFNIKEKDPLFVVFVVNKEEGFLSRLERGAVTALEVNMFDLLFRGGNSLTISTVKGGREGLKATPSKVTITEIVDKNGRTSYRRGNGQFASRQEIDLFKANRNKASHTGKLSNTLKGARKAALKKVSFYVTLVAGGANALFVSKGFNANIVATNSEGVRGLCKEFPK
tara:strand:+ start:95307 stop:96377 length:1071 start_codon:yes stop_codon:yes gene_type:complete